MDVKQIKAHRTEKEKHSMTTEEKIVMEGIKKADELAKDGAEVDGGAMAVANVFNHQTVGKQVRRLKDGVRSFGSRFQFFFPLFFFLISIAARFLETFF